MEVEAILAEVRRYPTRHVVVTGGEPMIAPEIVPLTEGLRGAGLHITIETAGTVVAPVACDLMSISPKTSNSTPRERDGGRWAAQHERLRFQPQVLGRLMSDYDYQLKFVVQQPEDLDEILRMVADLGADRRKVILMPEGTDPATLRQRSLWIAELCKREGFRLSPRLHVDLWGARRGV
jgi:7-carboxy-7-deazaguanine synthase